MKKIKLNPGILTIAVFLTLSLIAFGTAVHAATISGTVRNSVGVAITDATITVEAFQGDQCEGLQWVGYASTSDGSSGLWYYAGSSWSLLTINNAENMQAWTGGLTVDFGASGLWNYNGSSWSLLTTTNPDDMEGWATSLAADLGTSGLWNYDGSAWSLLTTLDSEDMIDVDLY